MANRVSYIIQLQDRFSRSARRISRQMQGIDTNADRAAQTINRRLSGSFNNLANVAKNALGGVIAAFSVREFITRGAAFQDSLADLSAITGATGESLRNLEVDVLRLAKSSAIAQDQVALAFAQVASAKSELLKDPKALAVVTEQVLLLANAAGISVPEAMQASVGALNQFSKGADDAARFVNVMAAGAKVGASLVRQTADALVDAGFASASAGLSFEQTNAAIQVLAKSELKGARAGVALRNILAIMGEVADGQLDPAVIGINKSLETFSKLNLTNNQLLKIFGRESKDAAAFLIKNVDLFKQYTKAVTGTNEAQRQADIRLATFSAKMRKLGVLINEAVIKTFLRLEPVINKQVEQLGRFFDTIDPGQIDALGDSLKSIVQILGILGNAIKIPLSLLKGMGTVVGELAAAIATLSFSQFTSLADAFSIGGKLFGVFERDRGTTAENVGGGIIRSQADVNVNLRAPEGVIESVKSKMSGNRSGLNMGVNMEPAG